MSNNDFTDFGKLNILKNKKTPLVKELFREVSENYDLMNDIMSFGVHRIWKNNFLDWMAPRQNYHLLDLAGGTGDIAQGFLNRGGGKATIADLNYQMLSVGKQKNSSIGVNDNLSWLGCNGENLPFNDNNFDIVSISFGLRNITHKSIALNEIFRVLKPGGRFMCLEFSKVNISVLNLFYQIWSSKVIPTLGEKISGQKENYEYLIESIKRFPDQNELSSLISNSNFISVKYRNLSGGIAAIHSGWKI